MQVSSKVSGKGGGKMILHLDGNEYDRQAAQELLREHGLKFRLQGGDSPGVVANPDTAEENLPLAFMEHFIDGIVILDAATAKVKYANNAFAEMLGYNLEEVHRLKVWDWDAVWSQEELEQMYVTRNWPGERFETRHRRKDGQILMWPSAKRPFYGKAKRSSSAWSAI